MYTEEFSYIEQAHTTSQWAKIFSELKSIIMMVIWEITHSGNSSAFSLIFNHRSECRGRMNQCLLFTGVGRSPLLITGCFCVVCHYFFLMTPMGA